MDITPKQLAAMIDHTQLRAYAVEDDFRKLCAEAREYGFAMVAINPGPVALCRELLEGSGVRVGAAIAFPLGQLTIAQKAAETASAIRDGAQEIDYVVNVGKLKEGNISYVRDEMRAIVEICAQDKVISKVIFETCYLTDDEKRALCAVALEVRPDFIKTSTGFGTGGATLQDVALMKGEVGDAVRVKASGGIRSMDAALKMVGQGAERLGTSAGIALVQALRGARASAGFVD